MNLNRSPESEMNIPLYLLSHREPVSSSLFSYKSNSNLLEHFDLLLIFFFTFGHIKHKIEKRTSNH